MTEQTTLSREPSQRIDVTIDTAGSILDAEVPILLDPRSVSASWTYSTFRWFPTMTTDDRGDSFNIQGAAQSIRSAGLEPFFIQPTGSAPAAHRGNAAADCPGSRLHGGRIPDAGSVDPQRGGAATAMTESAGDGAEIDASGKQFGG